MTLFKTKMINFKKSTIEVHMICVLYKCEEVEYGTRVIKSTLFLHFSIIDMLIMNCPIYHTVWK